MKSIQELILALQRRIPKSIWALCEKFNTLERNDCALLLSLIPHGKKNKRIEMGEYTN